MIGLSTRAIIEQAVIFVFCIAGFYFLASCSYFEKKAAPDIASSINKYCQNTPLIARDAMRAEINSLLINGANVKITCPGD